MVSRRLLWSLALLLGPATAHAAAPAAAPAQGPTLVNDDEPLPPPVPLAKDTLGGHLIAGASGAISAPFGELQKGYAARDLGAGFGAVLDVGFGLNRTLSVGVWGQGLWYSGSSACRFWQNTSRDPCSAMSITVGPFVRYHLLQGMRFDPWIVVGPGYRALSQETPNGTKNYAGIEWLHATFGGDYYVLRGVAIGPWVGLDGGVFAKRPNPLFGPQVKTAWHTELVTGLRIVLNIPGK